ncbi:hypothetical protein Ab1vBOLIVR4_gp56 [Agrobacterium phage OLIVR4]|nr:hypothetical protein Ab1vBOLIVR4_gp56 [Agrobacterium phage OLIVR4]
MDVKTILGNNPTLRAEAEEAVRQIEADIIEKFGRGENRTVGEVIDIVAVAGEAFIGEIEKFRTVENAAKVAREKVGL